MTTIGISEGQIQNVAFLLNRLLADEAVLYIRAKNFHWNVEGPHFRSLHAFFDEVASEAEINMDKVAERVRALGHFSIGRMQDFLELTRLGEESLHNTMPQDMLLRLLQDQETLIRNLRLEISQIANQLEDLGTADLLTSLLRAHETLAWKVRAHLRQHWGSLSSVPQAASGK